MKKVMSIVMLSFIALTLLPEAVAQTHPTVATAKYNYVMMTGVEDYVPAIIMTAAEMKQAEGEAYGDFQVLVYGAAVKQFADVTKGSALVKSAQEANATIVLCKFAVDKYGIDEKKLPKGVNFVGNAFMHGVELQKKGYISLGL